MKLPTVMQKMFFTNHKSQALLCSNDKTTSKMSVMSLGIFLAQNDRAYQMYDFLREHAIK